MKKLIALVLALTLVLSASSAFALTIGFSQIGQESDWRTANTDNVCNAIEEQGCAASSPRAWTTSSSPAL